MSHPPASPHGFFGKHIVGNPAFERAKKAVRQPARDGEKKRKNYPPPEAIHTFSDQQLRNLLTAIKLDTERIQEESGLFSWYVLRHHEVRHALGTKLHAGGLFDKGHEVNVVQLVIDLFGPLHHTKGDHHAHFAHSQIHDLVHRKRRAMPLTGAQKLLVVEQEIGFLHRHFKNIEQEVVEVHDLFEGKIKAAGMLLQLVHDQEKDFAAKVLPASFKSKREVRVEKVLLWFRHITTVLDNMIQVAKLHRRKNISSAVYLEEIIHRPTQSMTKVDVETLEIKCRLSIERIHVLAEEFKEMKIRFNKITRKHGKFVDLLSKWQKELPAMGEKIKNCQRIQKKLEAKIATADAESQKLDKHLKSTRWKFKSVQCPPIKCYAVIEREVLDLQRELDMWTGKIRAAEELSRFRQKTPQKTISSKIPGKSEQPEIRLLSPVTT